MLSKLIKYDLLFGLKRYGVLFILLCGTWLSGLAISLVGNSILNGIFLALNIIVSILFLGAYIITSLQFFYKSLSGDESYFSYALPVKTVNLVVSKLAVIWMWGAAMAGALVLIWASLYHAMIAPMGLVQEFPPGFLEPLILCVVFQFIMESCLLAFAISIHNTPRLKSANAGIVIVAVAAYVMTQIAGILILAVTCLWLYLSSPDIFSAMFADALSPGQELLLIQSIRNAVVASSAVLSPLFLWLTVRTVEKRRSI